jgi:peptidoglycan-N-acetylglucosamine deacetylase
MKNKFKLIFLSLCILVSIISFIPIEAFSMSDEKVIYLTFDDGPSRGPCSEILDILKEENVKGTFFILGNEIKGNEDVLKRIYDEGHSIGLHSMTHEKKNLYNNENDFLNEMLKVQDLIEKTIGFKSNILRFPFGANNNTYKLKKSLVELLHNNNFKIYDWTVDTRDGELYNASPETFIKNSRSKNNNITLLMHCGSANKNSPKALKSIISYYKENNYTFKTIDQSTPEIFHYVK